MDPEFTEKARKLIIQFRDEFLHGNINELKDFSFWKIAGNSKYDGTCTTWTLGKFDGDKTRIVYAIDYLLYVDEINQYVKEFYIPGYGKTYDWECNFSGDTINTFRLLLGNRFLLNNTEEKVEKQFKFELKQNLIQDKNDFFFTYQKIGNFYLLPKQYLKSINQFRAGKWSDYFDLFLKQMDLYFQREDKVDSSLMDYLEVGINKEFFSSFKNKSDEFYKIFNLGMYKDFSFSHPNQKYLCNYKNYSNLVKKGKESEYREFCASYISEATRLINQRSEEITDKLSTILNNLNGEK